MTYTIIKPERIYSSMMNDRQMAKQFVAMYLQQGRDDFEQLATSVARLNLLDIKNAAHHIKPTMAYVGADSLQASLHELETLATMEYNVSAITERFDEIKVAFGQLMNELEDFWNQI